MPSLSTINCRQGSGRSRAHRRGPNTGRRSPLALGFCVLFRFYFREHLKDGQDSDCLCSIRSDLHPAGSPYISISIAPVLPPLVSTTSKRRRCAVKSVSK